MNTIAMFALIVNINYANGNIYQVGPFASIVSCEAARAQVASDIRAACIRIDIPVNSK